MIDRKTHSYFSFYFVEKPQSKIKDGPLLKRIENMQVGLPAIFSVSIIDLREKIHQGPH